MKKRYGLLFLFCLLMFFCVNIDGVKADETKECFYKGYVSERLPVRNGRTTQEHKYTAAVGLTYTCKTNGDCSAKYVAKRTVLGGNKDIDFSARENVINTSSEFYSNGKIVCPPNIYIKHNGTYWDFSYKYKDGIDSLRLSDFDGSLNSAVEKATSKDEGIYDGKSEAGTGKPSDDASIESIKEWARGAQGSQSIENTGVTGDSNEISCSALLGKKFSNFLKQAFWLISIFGILLLIIFAAIDFIKVITSSEDNAMSEALKKVKNRVISIILLLLLPILVNFIIEILNNNSYVIKTINEKNEEVHTSIKIGKLSDCNITN